MINDEGDIVNEADRAAEDCYYQEQEEYNTEEPIMFKKIAQILKPGTTVTFTITGTPEHLTMAVLIKTAHMEQESIPPFTVSGRPEEIDDNLEALFTQPVVKISHAIANYDHVLKHITELNAAKQKNLTAKKPQKAVTTHAPQKAPSDTGDSFSEGDNDNDETETEQTAAAESASKGPEQLGLFGS